MSETDRLVPYAMATAASRGRRYPEPEHDFRSAFQRDRDRIVHSRAFRRLEYKTQVFVNHEGDHYRTRLTHSLEVSLIGRTVCRALRLNEDLVESLALSHDLGHTPFGHLGEDVLNALMAAQGGFNHNHQSLRIVEVLEDRYPGFPGLNLTWEVREGIAKHSGHIDPVRSPEFARYDPDTAPPLEAQMVDLVDEIAYNHHDIDDGLESGLLPLQSLTDDVPLFGKHHRDVTSEHPAATPFQVQAMTLRALINALVTDLVSTTAESIRAAGVRTLDDIRHLGRNLVALSPALARQNLELKLFLGQRLYRHPRMEETRGRYRGVLEGLWDRYTGSPSLLPAPHRLLIDGGETPQRVIGDYIAGMTDRYALDEYRRFFGIDPLADAPSTPN